MVSAVDALANDTSAFHHRLTPGYMFIPVTTNTHHSS